MKKAIHQSHLALFALTFAIVAMPAVTVQANDDVSLPPAVVAQDDVAPTVAATPSPAMMSPTVRSLGTLRTADMNLAPLPPTQKMKAEQTGTVAYMTGGVGQEERSALEAAKNNYNLHITIANSDGQFLSDTRIVIRNQKGDEVLEAVAGPIFYAQVPAGSYVIEAASSEGQIKKQTVAIGKTGKISSLHFTW